MVHGRTKSDPILLQLGEELPVNERQIVYSNNGSLVLKKILPTDAGTYSCIVTALDISAQTPESLRASQDLSVSVMGKV